MKFRVRVHEEMLLPAIILSIALALLLCRILFVLASIGSPLPPRSRPLKTLVVLGSGGHTAEMLDLMAMLDVRKYSPRCYVAAATDGMSLPRARTAEEKASAAPKDVEFCQVYRSREVGQSYLTSILTTLAAISHAMKIVFGLKPDLILCNGPGTCLPICIAGFLMHLLGLQRVIVVYVESIARVKKLSLTGLIFYRLHLMDQFFVQWPQLKERYPRTKYVGRLM